MIIVSNLLDTDCPSIYTSILHPPRRFPPRCWTATLNDALQRHTELSHWADPVANRPRGTLEMAGWRTAFKRRIEAIYLF